jgi:hypothetical protein
LLQPGLARRKHSIAEYRSKELSQVYLGDVVIERHGSEGPRNGTHAACGITYFIEIHRYIFNLTGTGFRVNNRGRVRSPLILFGNGRALRAPAGDNFRRKSQAARTTAIESIEGRHQ